MGLARRGPEAGPEYMKANNGFRVVYRGDVGESVAEE